MKSFPLSLYHKALLAILVILLPIAVTFWVGYSKNKEHAIKDSLKDLKFIAEGSENVVYFFLEMNKRRAEDFASDGFIRDQLKRIVEGHESDDALNSHLSKNKQPLDNTIHNISISSMEGKIVSSTDLSFIGLDVSTEPFFLKGKVSPSVSENVHRVTGDHELAISTPVIDRTTGDPIAVLANFIPLSELSRALSGDYAKDFGAITWGFDDLETRETYLVNRDKFMITDSRFIDDAVMKQVVDTEAVAACIQSNHETTGFYKDYRAVEVGGATMCIPSMGWILLVEQDNAETLSHIIELRNDALLTMIIVTLLISLLFILLNQIIIKPVNRLSSAANKISMGNYDVNIASRSGDEIGKLYGAFQVMIHEVKAATEILVDSEKRLTEAQRIALLGSWTWDVGEEGVAWSKDVHATFSMTEGEFNAVSENCIYFVNHDVREFLKNSANEGICEGKPYSIDHGLTLSSGVKKMVREEAKVLFDETGKAVRVIGTVQDITQRKKAEKELRKLFRAVEQSPTSIVITDKDGTIEYVNPKFAEVTGYFRNEVYGENPRILNSGEQSPEFYKEMWETITAGREWRGEFHNKKKNGELFWENAAITNEKGDITNFLAVKEDITKHKRLEEQARLQRKQLVQADKMKSLGVMVAGVAHEINNPNNFIMLNSEILRDIFESLLPIIEERHKNKDDCVLGCMTLDQIRERVPELLAGLTEGSKRIKHTVNNLKDFARQDVPGYKQDVDINTAVESAINIASSLIRKSTAHFSVEYGKDMPTIKGNQYELEQVVINLLTNACHALPDKERGIAVSTYHAPGSHSVFIKVKDEGVGIPADDMPTIMEPFFTTKRDSGGTGLGLSVSFSIIKNHRGKMEFSSEVGRGTEVTVRLFTSHEDMTERRIDAR